MISVKEDSKRFELTREALENSPECFIFWHSHKYELSLYLPSQGMHVTKIMMLNMHMLCLFLYNEGLFVHLREFVFLYFRKDNFS